MKCPICGQQLRPGKKDPNYLLCYNCKKKFKVPQNRKEQKHAPERREPATQETLHRSIKEASMQRQEEEEQEQKYSNIPPKSVRKKREDEMRKAYDELLAVEDGRKKKKNLLRP